MQVFKKAATGLVAALSMILFITGCSGDKQEAADNKNEKPVPVVVATAGASDFSAGIDVSGRVEAIQSANISTRVMGYITRVLVNTGDPVRQGQLLFTVNSTDILAKRAQTEAMIAQANAALANAQKDYDRFSVLYKQQSATAKELENVSLQYKAAQSGLNAARQMRNEVNAQLSYTNVTAPFSGVVTQKLQDAGSMATPGMPVLVLEQGGSLQVSASVSESQIAALHQGDEALLNIKSAGKVISGKITRISASSQATGGQYIIKISIPDADKKDLYSGMYVNVNIPVKNKPVPAAADNGVMVPLESIVNNNQLTGIYTVSSNNRAVLRWLRLGKQSGDKVEVLAGLGRNEAFIVKAGGRLYNGAPVSISK
ncbi:MAG: efflux RND transporter periplasmic adaptor subunit [Ferruginibacter sp.]